MMLVTVVTVTELFNVIQIENFYTRNGLLYFYILLGFIISVSFVLPNIPFILLSALPFHRQPGNKHK